MGIVPSVLLMFYLYIANMAAPTGREGANGISSKMVNFFKNISVVPCALVSLCEKRVSHRGHKGIFVRSPRKDHGGGKRHLSLSQNTSALLSFYLHIASMAAPIL